jgi:hypothetical protein
VCRAVNAIISQLRDVTCYMGSHRVTCHPAEANTSRLNPNWSWYSIYRPLKDELLSWPEQLWVNFLLKKISSPGWELNPVSPNLQAGVSTTRTTRLTVMRRTVRWRIKQLDDGMSFSRPIVMITNLSVSPLSHQTTSIKVWASALGQPHTVK